MLIQPIISVNVFAWRNENKDKMSDGDSQRGSIEGFLGAVQFEICCAVAESKKKKIKKCEWRLGS